MSNLKAIFPHGQTEITVNGLHQWDYGQKLEIYSDDFPAMVEVHFACPGMDSAVVRACAVVNGYAEAAIPDLCLEQTAPITAWVYLKGVSTGITAKTIILPITARTKPQPDPTVPTTVTNKYAEVVAGMNALVDATEKVMKENIEAIEGIIDDFKQDLDAGPELNADKKLTEGSGFYYVVLYENGSANYCSGMMYWAEGVMSYLGSVMIYNVGDSYYGEYTLDVHAERDGTLHAYQRATSKTGNVTRSEVTGLWEFYTKKFTG